jgi:hypothetical protein
MTMQSTSTVVNTQWSSRPADERFTSLPALAAFARYRKDNSKALKVRNRDLTVIPSATNNFDVAIQGPQGNPVNFTHWSFSQLASLAGVPAKYLRSGLPGALIADNLNWSLHHSRAVEEIGVLLRRNSGSTEGLHAKFGDAHLAAATGPDYGRIYDSVVCDHLIDQFGDGVTGNFRVPGEFGKALNKVTKENTTIYGSDRDIWVFLADETNRVEIEDRRQGAPGSYARGFYATNSEVGGGVLGFGMFLFDYLCCNRIMWGMQGKHELRIRHTAGAPLRWNEEVKPILTQLARTDTSPKPIQETLRAAQATKLNTDVETFLASRFGKSTVVPIMAAHQTEELRPIETIFDVTVGATAYAKTLTHQDTRVAIERAAGDLLMKLAPAKTQPAFASLTL